jgi:hypothetical protein
MRYARTIVSNIEIASIFFTRSEKIIEFMIPGHDPASYNNQVVSMLNNLSYMEKYCMVLYESKTI